MHVDESGDLQQLKRAKIRYLVPKFTWVPFPFCCGHLPFHPPPFLPLEGLKLHQQVVEVEEGEVQEGEVEEGPLCGRLGGAVGMCHRGGRDERVAASAGGGRFVENLYVWWEGRVGNRQGCLLKYEHTALCTQVHFLPVSI